MSFKEKLLDFYDKKYKLLMIIPIILIIFAIGQIAYQTYQTGDFVHKGVGLKGGSAITLYKESPVKEMQSFLDSKFPGEGISVREITSAGKTLGLVIDSERQDKDGVAQLVAAVKEQSGANAQEYTVEIVGSSLGESFFKQTIWAVIIAFIVMGIVVFAYFRQPIPSLAVIAAGASDIIVTLAIFNLTGMKLGTAGVAAFLMLIGYSIDTDMLLTSRVLKRKEGTEIEKIIGAVKTGLTMTITTITAVIVSLIFIESEIVKQIMLILLIGLFVDMIMTWIQNVGILRLYLEHQRKKAHAAIKN